MNNWIIVAIIAGLLLFGGVVAIKAVSATDNAGTPTGATCTSCGNSCTAKSNCGLATCGAANGGKCTCGQK